MIGIIVAMEREMTLLKADMQTAFEETVSGMIFWRGTLKGREVVLVTCGIGKVNAAICAQTMILRYQPELIVNVGVGGSLNEQLDIGDLVIASRTVQHDMDTSPIGDPVGFVSGVNRIFFDADPDTVKKLAACAAAAGIHYTVGTIASGDQFISTIAEKERIRSLFAADACEMEGAAIGHVCAVNDTPYAVVRAVSDKADGTSCTDFNAFADRSATQAAALVEAFLTC